MRFLAIVCGLSLLGVASAQAGDVTYTKDVAPILYKNCMGCHRAGEIAPMSLRTYKETRPWAKSIKEKVATRAMPPWFASPEHGEFSNDPTLTQDEIDLIVAWVDGGAVRGDRKDMPDLPTFTEGWQDGIPDEIIELPEVNIPAEGGDIFPNLFFKTTLDESKWIEAVEIRPSNRDVAHHVVVFMNREGTNMMDRDFDVLGTWSVGTEPNRYPEGMGRRLKNGQTLIANMHYHPNGTATRDVTRIGLYYGEGDLENEVKATLGGTYAFKIPAGAAAHRVVDSWNVENDIKVISLFPHMHLRGSAMKFTAIFPDGNEQILLDVPEYDFNWQLFYYVKNPFTLPAGSKIEIEAIYDNSTGNPNNPDPTRDVGFGLASTEEMMFGIFEYVHVNEETESTD